MPVDIAELERRARRLPTPEVYDYYAGGAGRERTPRANVGTWRKYWLRPRVPRDVSTVDTRVRLPVAAEFARAPGITADLAHAMALAGAQTLTGIGGVTGPTTAHSLDT